MKIWLIAPLAILLLPVLLPYAVFCIWLDRHRLRRAARKSACPECGAILGVEALELAIKAVRERMAERRRKFPHLKFRLARPEDAVCLRCGATLRFEEKTRTIHLSKPTPSTDQPNA